MRADIVHHNNSNRKDKPTPNAFTSKVHSRECCACGFVFVCKCNHSWSCIEQLRCAGCSEEFEEYLDHVFYSDSPWIPGIIQ